MKKNEFNSFGRTLAMPLKHLTPREMLRDIHIALRLDDNSVESPPDEMEKIGRLLSSILNVQAQQIELLRSLTERVGRISPR